VVISEDQAVEGNHRDLASVADAAASGWEHSGFRIFFQQRPLVHQIIARTTAVASACSPSAADYWAFQASAVGARAGLWGPGTAAVVRYALVLIGAVTTLLVTLAALRRTNGNLLLGRGGCQSLRRRSRRQQACPTVRADSC